MPNDRPDLCDLPTGDTSWFEHDRFGLFVHWDLYSLAARHEWVKSIEKTPDADYDRRYFEHFDPDLYDPRAWAAAAANAGMKYGVVTTKHHEGFCLWDSPSTDYKATNTPAGRDLLRPLVEAFRAENMKVGFYHSLLDWHHRDYVVDHRNHPRRDALARLDAKSNAMVPPSNGSEHDGTDINAGRDPARYAAYLREQVRELLTDFGEIASLWFDFSFASKDPQARGDYTLHKGREAWESEGLYRMIRELQPGVLVTDRLDLEERGFAGDFVTPEQAQPWRCVTARGSGPCGRRARRCRAPGATSGTSTIGGRPAS